VAAVEDRMARVVAGSATIEVRAGGVGAFPTARSPRVLWIGVEDASGRLARLAGGADQALSELGFIKEERPVRSHLTIGRVKEGRASLEDVIQNYAGRDCGASTIREVVLYESRLRAKGAEYVARARVPFAAAAQSASPTARPIATALPTPAPATQPSL